jgi:hypothetical protein
MLISNSLSSSPFFAEAEPTSTMQSLGWPEVPLLNSKASSGRKHSRMALSEVSPSPSQRHHYPSETPRLNQPKLRRLGSISLAALNAGNHFDSEDTPASTQNSSYLSRSYTWRSDCSGVGTPPRRSLN